MQADTASITKQKAGPAAHDERAGANHKFLETLRVRCPASLPTAVDKAAAKNLMSASEYVRRSVIDRLRADGVDPLGPLQSETVGS